MSLRESLSDKFISGSGIEIGGLHFPLPVKEGVKVTYVDVAEADKLKDLHPDVEPKKLDIVVDNAEELMEFEDGTQDFVIANHVFEHCEDVIRTLSTWLRVLKPGGIIYAAVPEKTHTFDKDRQITTIRHVFKDFAKGVQSSRMEHYRDWYANSTLEKKTGQELEDSINAAAGRNQNIHWHVWDYAAQKKLFAWLSEILPFEILSYVTLTPAEAGNEVIWILRKTHDEEILV